MKLLEMALRKAHLPGTGGVVKGYCLKCKAYRRIKDVNLEYMKNGRPRLQGSCAACRARMSILARE